MCGVSLSKGLPIQATLAKWHSFAMPFVWRDIVGACISEAAESLCFQRYISSNSNFYWGGGALLWPCQNQRHEEDNEYQCSCRVWPCFHRRRGYFLRASRQHRLVAICRDARNGFSHPPGACYSRLQFGQELLRSHVVKLHCGYRIRSRLRRIDWSALCVAGWSVDVALKIFDRLRVHCWSIEGGSRTSTSQYRGIAAADCDAIFEAFLAPDLSGFVTCHGAGCQPKNREAENLICIQQEYWRQL